MVPNYSKFRHSSPRTPLAGLPRVQGIPRGTRKPRRSMGPAGPGRGLGERLDGLQRLALKATPLNETHGRVDVSRVLLVPPLYD